MELLASTEGVLTEPAGGTTVAATMKLAQQGVIGPDDTVVVVISGNGLKTLSEQPDPALAGNGRPATPRRWTEVVNDFRQLGRRAPHAARAALASLRAVGEPPQVEGVSHRRCGRAGSTSTSPKRGRATTSSSACTAGRSTGTSGGT